MRHSENGFYCSDCGKFIYDGYDCRDHENIRTGDAYCPDCFEVWIE